MATAGSPAQTDYWNGPVGERWARDQEALDLALAPFGAAALARADLRSGESVVDVGCGCGASALAAAESVGPSGRVLGVDVSAPMLARARQRGAGLAHLGFELADASTHRFASPADALVSRFGVMFFADPVAAFTNLRGALAPRGRLAFVCWAPLTDNPWIRIPFEAAAQHLVADPPGDPHAPGPFAFSDPARVKGILTAAGFAEIATTRFEAGVVLSASGLRAAVQFTASTGPTARMLQASEDPAARARALQAVEVALAPLERNGRVTLEGATWIASARSLTPTCDRHVLGASHLPSR